MTATRNDQPHTAVAEPPDRRHQGDRRTGDRRRTDRRADYIVVDEDTGYVTRATLGRGWRPGDAER